MVVAVIADIVGSRQLVDRGASQRALEQTFARTHHDHPVAARPFRPTVADEAQAVYPSLEDALAAVLLVQLALPDGLECRFGVGIGDIRPVDSATGDLFDGPGWWTARDAIEKVHAMQQRAVPGARTWIVEGEEEDADMPARVALANAYLLARDQVVQSMTERARRLTYGRCLGRTQQELAAAEGITQPAVSQALAGAGAPAVVEGFRALVETARR